MYYPNNNYQYQSFSPAPSPRFSTGSSSRGSLPSWVSTCYVGTEGGLGGRNTRHLSSMIEEEIPTDIPEHIIFDGIGNWSGFYHKYDLYADKRRWFIRQRTDNLKFCLTGSALKLYTTIIQRNPNIDYFALVAEMKHYFTHQLSPICTEEIPTDIPDHIIFDGTRSWLGFYHRFDLYADNRQWSSKQRTSNLKFCLRGEALGLYTRIIQRNPYIDYFDLVAEMKHHYLKFGNLSETRSFPFQYTSLPVSQSAGITDSLKGDNLNFKETELQYSSPPVRQSEVIADSLKGGALKETKFQYSSPSVNQYDVNSVDGKGDIPNEKMKVTEKSQVTDNRDSAMKSLFEGLDHLDKVVTKFCSKSISVEDKHPEVFSDTSSSNIIREEFKGDGCKQNPTTGNSNASTAIPHPQNVNSGVISSVQISELDSSESDIHVHRNVSNNHIVSDVNVQTVQMGLENIAPSTSVSSNTTQIVQNKSDTTCIQNENITLQTPSTTVLVNIPQIVQNENDNTQTIHLAETDIDCDTVCHSDVCTSKIQIIPKIIVTPAMNFEIPKIIITPPVDMVQYGDRQIPQIIITSIPEDTPEQINPDDEVIICQLSSTSTFTVPLVIEGKTTFWRCVL